MLALGLGLPVNHFQYLLVSTAQDSFETPRRSVLRPGLRQFLHCQESQKAMFRMPFVADIPKRARASSNVEYDVTELVLGVSMPCHSTVPV